MPVLIDTHTFIWFVEDSGELSQTARSLIEASTTEVLMSVVSLWEMSIKTALGKLILEGGFERVSADLAENLIEVHPINFAHTLKNNQLPFHHRDPFDRMIAAQALVDGLDLVSADDMFDRYFEGSEVHRIW